MSPISTMLVALSFGALTAQSLASPKVVSMPMYKRNSTFDLSKRDAFSASLQNYLPGSQYFVTAKIGTPAQTLELLIDTGSSDTWMYSPGSCVGPRGAPCLGGTFNSGGSNSYKAQPSLGTYRNRYGDGSKVQGNYFTDNFGIGGEIIKDLTMALVTVSSGTIRDGIMGMGLDTGEARTALHQKPYQNLPDVLKSQGLISSRAFSLYLDDLEESTGSVLFGGYDTEKFSGDIVMLPIEDNVLSGTKDAYTVSLTGFGVTLSKEASFILSSGYPYPVILDSGTSLIYLPLELFEPLIRKFHLLCEHGICLVDCALSGGTFDFEFGGDNGPKIAVPYEELAVPIYDPRNSRQEDLRPGEPACTFGLQPQQPGLPYVFGQPFLRSAYALYDIDNMAVGLAQAKYAAASSNVVEYTGTGAMQRVVSDTAAPKALETGRSGGIGRLPRVSFTEISPVPSAFATIPHPDGRPAAAQPTTLSPQITPMGGEDRSDEGGGRSGNSNGNGNGNGNGNSSRSGSESASPSGTGSSSGGPPSSTTASGSNTGSSAAIRAYSSGVGLLMGATLLSVLLGAVAAL